MCARTRTCQRGDCKICSMIIFHKGRLTEVDRAADPDARFSTAAALRSSTTTGDEPGCRRRRSIARRGKARGQCGLGDFSFLPFSSLLPASSGPVADLSLQPVVGRCSPSFRSICPSPHHLSSFSPSLLPPSHSLSVSLHTKAWGSQWRLNVACISQSTSCSNVSMAPLSLSERTV